MSHTSILNIYIEFVSLDKREQIKQVEYVKTRKRGGHVQEKGEHPVA